MRQASGNVVEPKGEEELRELKEKLGFLIKRIKKIDPSFL